MTDLPSLPFVFPHDYRRAVLIGRVWVPGQGAVLVHVRDDVLHDISHLAPTCSALLQLPDPARAVRRGAPGAIVAETPAVVQNSLHHIRQADTPWFLAPCDLQAIQAVGVSFLDVFIERLMQDLAKGDSARAQALHDELQKAAGESLDRIVPDSEAAERLRQALQSLGARRIDLDAALGPEADIFTKAQPMSAVGLGAEVGIHPRCRLSHSEPELVLAISHTGQVKGATLGNDLTSRDFERRSPYLRSRAKDNNASCAMGPFIRLFDDNFNLEDVYACQVELQVTGHGTPADAEGAFEMHTTSSMARISRDPIDLVRQTLGDNHQYPDGLMLMLGSRLGHTADRLAAGQGFTHCPGDVVRISAPQLGCLVNQVNRSDRIAPWTYGTGQLIHDLARRGVLKGG